MKHETDDAATWWAEAEAALATDGAPITNMAQAAVDRHVDAGAGDVIALRWLPKSGPAVDLTYAELARQTNRFARILSELPGEGDPPVHRVASLCGRIPLLYIAALGTLKANGVYAPLFSAFGPEPIRMRMELGTIDVLVTTAAQYRRKVVGLRAELPALRHVFLVDGDAASFDDPSVVDLAAALDAADPTFDPPDTDPEQPALLHFTSGTTGRPKGALHVHRAAVAHWATGHHVLGLHPGARYWCTADPGWVTGTSYGIMAPLLNGASCLIDEAEFDAARWYRLLDEESIELFYTAPTALRMLQRAGSDVREDRKLESLRLLASVGEPLDPESVTWAQGEFEVPVLDTWWQTETGAIMIANRVGIEVKPGSMGTPIPGIDATVLAIDDEGEIVIDDAGAPVELGVDQVGELSLRIGWPSMFRTYLGDDERYQASFAGDWYHSGDLARRDADGHFWFVGRNNDVIKSAGHLIGPFEVESALVEHPSVVEAGVIGKPHPTMGAVVKAFVVPTDDAGDPAELERALMAHSRSRLGAAVAPREIELVDNLPHTRSGKIMRRLLKARELGLAEGDTSTLETPA